MFFSLHHHHHHHSSPPPTRRAPPPPRRPPRSRPRPSSSAGAPPSPPPTRRSCATFCASCSPPPRRRTRPSLWPRSRGCWWSAASRGVEGAAAGWEGWGPAEAGLREEEALISPGARSPPTAPRGRTSVPLLGTPSEAGSTEGLREREPLLLLGLLLRLLQLLLSRLLWGPRRARCSPNSERFCKKKFFLSL